MMPKNIIVCADGTGNKGGYSPDSNVYKIYKMVDKHYKGVCKDGVNIEEQVLFYDNGVGTQSNKIWRAISGGFGLGFGRNVSDLYKFLARSYVQGDRIFFFGFSRGASTVRACNGMIAKCGLAKGEGLRNSELDALVAEAYKVYEQHRKNPRAAEDLKNDPTKSHGAVEIQFLGVWDTVVALGFPKLTDVTGPLTLLMNIVFGGLEKIFDFVFPHSFYHYKLTDNVKHACQALAIDDERTAFWPYVWQEKDIKDAQDRTKDNVEQVWFSGMHSNVGGGYKRAGMAGVALHWMMKRAEHHGLAFNKGAMQQVYDASHIHGRLYNSRSGLATIYRYHPRQIEKLCANRLLDDIKLHCSVLERLCHRTANYTPGYIPASFDVVDDAVPAKTKRCNPGSVEGWAATRERIDKLVWARKKMYGLMLATVLGIVGYAIYLWNSLALGKDQLENWGNVAKTLDYFTPDMFDGLIHIFVVQQPAFAWTTIALFTMYYLISKALYHKTVSTCETLRHFIIVSKPQDDGQETSKQKKSTAKEPMVEI